jgi:Ca2+-binding EF-hand superfamily protein
MMRRVDPGFTSDEIKAAFQVIQCDEIGCEKGMVNENDLVTFLTSFGSDKPTASFSKDKVVELVQQMKSDGNGYIEYDEFVDLMMN